MTKKVFIGVRYKIIMRWFGMVMDEHCNYFVCKRLLRRYLAMSSIYVENEDMIILTLAGALSMGSTWEWAKRFNTEPVTAVEAYQQKLAEYLDLKRLVGTVDNNNIIIPGEIKPLMVYYKEPFDMRIHLALISNTTIGKSSIMYIIKKLATRMELVWEDLQNPTSAHLLGSTNVVKVGNKHVIVPKIPSLLKNDIVLLDEGRDLFSQRVSDYERKNLAIIRKTMDIYGKSILHNDTVTNIFVDPFMGRSTIILGTFTPKNIEYAISEGTLPRFLIYAPRASIEMDLRIINEQAMNLDEEEQKKLAYEKTACEERLIKNISEPIKRMRQLRAAASQPHHWYLKYDLPAELYNKVIHSYYKELFTSRLSGPVEDHVARRAFELRARELIIKIGGLISIINGKDKVGEEELIYARDYVFNTLDNVNRVLYIYEYRNEDTETTQQIINTVQKELPNVGWTKMEFYQAISAKFGWSMSTTVRKCEPVLKYLTIIKDKKSGKNSQRIVGVAIPPTENKASYK